MEYLKPEPVGSTSESAPSTYGGPPGAKPVDPRVTHGLIGPINRAKRLSTPEEILQFFSRRGMPARISRTRQPDGRITTCISMPPASSTRHARPVASPRASRSSSPRRQGSRRTGASSSTSSSDPGDPDGDDPPGSSAPQSGPGEKAERICLAVDCRRSIDHLAPQARWCSDACRVRDQLARETRDELAIEAWREGAARDKERHSVWIHALRASRASAVGSDDGHSICACSDKEHKWAPLDPDGDPICHACGRPRLEHYSRPNGFDAKAREMVTDGDGFYLVAHHRRLGREWLPKRKETPAPVRHDRLPPRECPGCGAHLRRGNTGPLCEPCALAEVVA
jgi:hypothetical protein